MEINNAMQLQRWYCVIGLNLMCVVDLGLNMPMLLSNACSSASIVFRKNYTTKFNALVLKNRRFNTLHSRPFNALESFMMLSMSK